MEGCLERDRVSIGYRIERTPRGYSAEPTCSPFPGFFPRLEGQQRVRWYRTNGCAQTRWRTFRIWEIPIPPPPRQFDLPSSSISACITLARQQTGQSSTYSWAAPADRSTGFCVLLVRRLREEFSRRNPSAQRSISVSWFQT